MARSFLAITFAFAAAILILFGTGATPAFAQPGVDVAVSPVPEVKSYGDFDPSNASQLKTYPEVQEAVRRLAPARDKSLADAFREVGQDPVRLPATAPEKWLTILSERPQPEPVLRLLDPTREMPDILRLLENAARKYPELPSGQVMMYRILAQNKEPKAAGLWLNAAIRDWPSDPEPYLILGNLALQDRRVFEAASDFDKAKQLLAAYTSQNRKAALERQLLSGLAEVAEIRQSWKEAEACLRDLRKLAPDDLPAQKRLARDLFWQGNAKEAYKVLKEAKQFDRENAVKNKTPEVFLAPEAVMAQYYDEFEGPRFPNAEKWFHAALNNAPGDLNIRVVVADWALATGRNDFAQEQAEAALRIEAADANLTADQRKYQDSNVGHLLRGRVALCEKDWLEAERDFQTVLMASPNDFVARNNIALALVEQNDPAKKTKALIYAAANYRDTNKSPDVLATLGWVYFRRGEFDQAGLALDSAVKAAGEAIKATYLPPSPISPIASGAISNQTIVPAGATINPDLATYVAHFLYHHMRESEAKAVLTEILKSDRAFMMRPEAQELFEKVKDAKP
jgi:tetratricopeptide (TPR) repeat protein